MPRKEKLEGYQARFCDNSQEQEDSESLKTKIKKVLSFSLELFLFWSLVGATGFEPAALRSRTVRATKLRYAPQRILVYCFLFFLST
jgi:hypothetical protein